MIRNARLFFKAVSLGFLMPAAIVGAGLYWVSHDAPAPGMTAAGAGIDATSATAVPGSNDAPADRRLAAGTPPSPPVAIVTGSLGSGSLVTGTLGPEAKLELTMKIQAELRRLGCMREAVDGTWSDATAGAMRTFVEDRQLGLPTDAPSGLLLLMLEADNSSRCVGSRVTPATSTDVLIPTSGTLGKASVDTTPAVKPAASADPGSQPETPKQSAQTRRGSSAGTNPRSTFSVLDSNSP